MLLVAFAAGLATRKQPRWCSWRGARRTSSLLAGLIQWGKELKVIGQVAAEQRVDFVTGLYNRRTFDERLTAEHSRTKRTGTGYAIAVFELDDYDQLSEADKINGMKMLAESLKRVGPPHRHAREHRDQSHRGADGRHARRGRTIGVERARERFFFRSCGHDDDAQVTRPLTVSVGIAAWDDSIVDGQHVIDNAEETIRGMRKPAMHGVRIHRRAHGPTAERADEPVARSPDDLESRGQPPDHEPASAPDRPPSPLLR